LKQTLGVYISVPFCKAKCSYCNFASGVVGAGTAGAERIDAYVQRVCAEIRSMHIRSMAMHAHLPRQVDSVFFGGGTPSLLSASQMRLLFAALRSEFDVTADAEITLECAPGQLSDITLDELLRQGMNRISFGVQSFVDAEASAVGRLHTRKTCLAEIERIRAAGVHNINVDLIAGLPRQTAASWRESVNVALDSAVPHLSVYMLEVDEDSRLGRELLAHGTRYGVESVSSDDETAERYAAACEWLEDDGVMQYEISNFARNGHASQHNVKYWRREPYVGFGLDAHSMLRSGADAVRWANTHELELYIADQTPGTPQQGNAALVQLANRESMKVERIGNEKGFEEAMFLGLRMNEGVNLESLRAEFGAELVQEAVAALGDVEQAGLIVRDSSNVRLSAQGRMVSNEVFSRLLVVSC